jgi:hypothetical protein
MNKDMINKSLNILKTYAYLEDDRLEDGTLLIAKAPHIAPLAWLHCIYAPLKNEDILIFEKEIGKEIPNEYGNFLKISNGLSVFNTTLSLFGKRNNYKRSIDAAWQPFDLVLPNTHEKPYNATGNEFIIGCYDWDGSYLYINRENKTIHLCKNDDIKSLYEWESFEDMLYSEIRRLVELFDSKGKEKDINKSTLPV